MHLRQLNCITKRKKNHLWTWKRALCEKPGFAESSAASRAERCSDVKSSLALRQRDANELVKSDTICKDMQMHREGITNTLKANDDI